MAAATATGMEAAGPGAGGDEAGGGPPAAFPKAERLNQAVQNQLNLDAMKTRAQGLSKAISRILEDFDAIARTNSVPKCPKALELMESDEFNHLTLGSLVQSRVLPLQVGTFTMDAQLTDEFIIVCDEMPLFGQGRDSFSCIPYHCVAYYKSTFSHTLQMATTTMAMDKVGHGPLHGGSEAGAPLSVVASKAGKDELGGMIANEHGLREN